MALSLLVPQPHHTFPPHPHHTYPASFAKPPLQGGWNSLTWLCGITKRDTPTCGPYSRMVWVACTASQSGGQSFWSFLFPHRFIYSSNPEDVDLAQLSQLWAKTLDVNRNPFEIAKALKHSCSFVVVLDKGEGSEMLQRRLVGFGRAVSDGAFIATICDVAVDPAYQRRGIGRRIVKELVKNMKRKGGATGFAVFPPPKARVFFWSIGFRSDRSFRFMTYRGRLLNSATQDEDQLDTE